MPNGSLFISESLLEAVIQEGGLSGLVFLLCHELSHLIKGHLRTNLSKSHRYGDLRRQLFLFTNQYTGFDALFIDHFTNMRYTLDQEAEADQLALRILEENAFDALTPDQYRNILKLMQDHRHK